MTEVQLPYPDPQFNGTIEPALRDSTSDFPEDVKPPEDAPNILLMMTDDVGFGTSSTFGGPVKTTTMDKLAKEGIRYNRFHTTSLCSPTRASLLTGRQPHNVATGYIVDGAIGYPGYDSKIPKDSATIAAVLKENGYATSWFGKNHNTPKWQTSQSGPFDRWPTGLGFDYFYGFNGGDSNQFQPNLFENTLPVTPQPHIGVEDYHLDKDMADKAIAWLRKQTSNDKNKPFFMYYAPGSAHSPHHVPKEHLDDYKGQFDDGWDALRTSIHAKQIEMGIIPADTVNTDRHLGLPAWDSLEADEKEVFTRMMEVYAAFLDHTDMQMGRIVDEIKRLGRANNTLVIYIQGDNGGSAEGTMQGSLNEMAVIGNRLGEDFRFIYSNKEDIGTDKHFNHFPVPWAWALNAPMQWVKRFASHFGGTRNGMVMKFPGKITASTVVRQQFHHVCDIAPTILEAAGIPMPTEVNGIKQVRADLDGVAMNYTWDENNLSVEGRQTQLFEMLGNRGIYHEGWMACTTPFNPWDDSENPEPDTVYLEDFKWELYDVRNDFSQGIEMSAQYPDKLKELQDMWMVEAEKNKIFPVACSQKERSKEGDPIGEMIEGDQENFTYYNGTGIPESAAPSLKNVTFTLSCSFDIPDTGTASGVIVAEGGRFGGMGLLMFDNKPRWVYKLTQNKNQAWQWDGSALAPGTHLFVIKFEYKGGDDTGGPGTFTFTDDGVTLGTMDLEETVPNVFCMTENLDVGQDTGTPLHEDYVDRRPFNYSGELDKVDVWIDKGGQSEKLREKIRNSNVEMEMALD